jgi:hypothetical protein
VGYHQVPDGHKLKIESMTDVGYQQVPDGHKVKIESMTDVGYHHVPDSIIGTFSETSGLAKKNKNMTLMHLIRDSTIFNKQCFYIF